SAPRPRPEPLGAGAPRDRRHPAQRTVGCRSPGGRLRAPWLLPGPGGSPRRRTPRRDSPARARRDRARSQGRRSDAYASGPGPRPPLVVNRGVSFQRALASRWLDGSRLVARIVAVCQAIKDDLVRQGVPAAKIDVVYSGTDTERFDPARATGTRIRDELGLDGATPLVTQIGVPEPKAHHHLLP